MNVLALNKDRKYPWAKGWLADIFIVGNEYSIGGARAFDQRRCNWRPSFRGQIISAETYYHPAAPCMVLLVPVTMGNVR
ncbi:hypothetical protein SAMD00023353_3901150 [Rosellinia necatrix]|uniref:Uncharacterized protein n=1 Tax=Rosellinia necatrix TaxID=77044 RepID=A0A1S8A985_ROSNE|nr:hypothetical protein SAMD00023353_3901150 [Rosellinia necatrix]